jgi:ribosomal-protein-alanine N-acetyltransferase
MCVRFVRDGVTTVAPDADSPRIRQAERADLLAVHRIEQQAFPQPWPFSAFEQYLDRPGFLVAMADGGVAGYVVADSVPNHGRPLGHVKDIAVRESHRCRGIGTALLERSIGVLRSEGASSVKLEVREGNEDARSLYRAHGFEHRRTIPRYYADGENALVLVRPL